METTTTDSKKGKPIGKDGIASTAIASEIKQLGWQVKNNENRDEYFAQEIKGDKRSIGPVKTLEALKAQVMLASGPPVEKKKGNGRGEMGAHETAGRSRQRLPTMEEPEIDELNLQSDICLDAKEKRDQAKTEFADACDVMREKMREFGRKRYNRRGMSLVIEESEKLVIKKAEAAPPKNPSTKRGGKQPPLKPV